jgi:hypothetical protein
MMPEPPTPYAGVNEVLRSLLAQVQSILGSHFAGMYRAGSLALGDFNPETSDIDVVIVTDAPLSTHCFAALQAMHAAFAAGASPWAAKLEAVYIPRAALRGAPPPGARYPVLERDRPSLAWEPLEDGWSVQCYTLREYGVPVAGPDPRALVALVDPDEMRRAGAAIAGMWLEQARSDPSWLAWLRRRANGAFVVLTLCRLLYTLESGAVASKPGAARWAQQTLDPHWADLINRALAGQQDSSEISDSDEGATVALIALVVDRFWQWETAAGGARTIAGANREAGAHNI